MSPPLSSLGAQLGTHLLQAKVKLRFVWAGLPLKDPCRGPVVAAPGVEDEGTHLQIKNLDASSTSISLYTSPSPWSKLLFRTRITQSIRLLYSSCESMKREELEFSISLNYIIISEGSLYLKYMRETRKGLTLGWVLILSQTPLGWLLQ